MPGPARLFKLLSLPALALVGVAAAAPAAVAPGGARADPEPAPPRPLALEHASLRQDGDALVLRLATTERWSPASLRRTRRSLCLRLVFDRGGAVTSRDVCVRRRGRAATLTYARVLRSGASGPLHALDARVRKPSPRSLTARFAPARLGIPYGPLRWRVLSTTDGCRIADATGCFAALPAAGEVLTLRAPQPIGCRVKGPAYVTYGSRGKRVVALTFDDGPSAHTAAVLDVLRAKRARATFFMIGRQVGGGAALVRRMLAEGHEPANHTWDHANVSAGGSAAASSIRATNAAIERAVGYRPCTFRAPYGAHSPTLISAVRAMGMSTIQWDVDTQDWMTPGADVIATRIIRGARNGSIILMHDGGGPRGQTVAALPRVIDALRARGFRFVTVAELLGYAPVMR